MPLQIVYHFEQHLTHLTYPEVGETVGAPQMTSQPTSSIPPCPRPLSGPHPVSGCPFSDVVLPSLSLSASRSLSPHCALYKIVLASPFDLTTCPYHFSLRFHCGQSGGHQKARWIVEFVFFHHHWWCGLCTRCRGVCKSISSLWPAYLLF